MNTSQMIVTNPEKQVKFSQGRVAQIEKHFGGFCEILGSVTRKHARIRDKGDIFSHLVASYAENETLNNSTRNGLKQFSVNYSTVQDYRQAMIHRMEDKVLKPMAGYGPRCKQMKNMIKTEKGAQSKVLKTQQQLEKLRKKNGADPTQILETDLQRFNNDATVCGRQLETAMNRFEQEKLTDLKHILKEFVSVEMVFHAKALEFLSKCFQNIEEIDEESDLQEFQTALMESGGMSRAQIMEALTMAGGGGTLGQTGSTFRTGTMTSMDSTLPLANPQSPSTIERTDLSIAPESMYGDEEDDEDDEEDEDDEYED